MKTVAVLLTGALMTGGASVVSAQNQAPVQNKVPAQTRAEGRNTDPHMTMDVQTFVRKAVQSNQFEISSSRLALQQATDPAVRSFAQKMVDDHGKVGEKLTSILPAALKPPIDANAALGQEEQQKMEQLRSSGGEQFDQLYIELQREAHREAVALFRAYVEHGKEPALVDFARETLPELENHHRMIEQMAS